jgi:hypothetical protein
LCSWLFFCSKSTQHRLKIFAKRFSYFWLELLEWVMAVVVAESSCCQGNRVTRVQGLDKRSALGCLLGCNEMAK